MVRPITPDELSAFCELADDPPRLQEWLVEMFAAKASAPELCHVLTEHGAFIAGVVYINFPAVPGDFGLWRLLGTPSVQFLQRSLPLLIPFQAERLETQVSSLDMDAAERRALLEACGFRHLQAKARYEFDAGSATIDAETTLHLEPFESLGRNGFVDLIAVVTRDTLDRSQRAEFARLGRRQWAESFFELLLALDPNFSHWRAATVDGRAVGLVVPQMFGPEAGAINYIGVVPEYRGRNISGDLLKAGTAELIQAGAREIVAEIDVENHPLAASLAAIGYRRTSELDCYCIEIVQTVA